MEIIQIQFNEIQPSDLITIKWFADGKPLEFLVAAIMGVDRALNANIEVPPHQINLMNARFCGWLDFDKLEVLQLKKKSEWQRNLSLK